MSIYPLTERPLSGASEIRRLVIGAALDVLATWVARGSQRKALRQLAEEGRLLRDIGLTREQALREAAKPFWRR
jgi:uncharacterized protein YjiS (DUF1127 family)